MATEEWIAAHQEEMRQYRRKHYRENRDHHIARARKRRLETRQWLLNFKKTISCSLCPESDPCCIDFHHRVGEKKVLEVSSMVAGSWSLSRIVHEISKCDSICSNCHRKIISVQNGWYGLGNTGV